MIMDSRLVEKYFNETLLKNCSLVSQTASEEITSDEDISDYAGSRSIAHMLSPIKPVSCENSSEKSLIVLQCPQDIISVRDSSLASVYATPSWSPQSPLPYDHSMSSCSTSNDELEKSLCILSNYNGAITSQEEESSHLLPQALQAASTDCVTKANAEVHSPLDCDVKIESEPLEVEKTAPHCTPVVESPSTAKMNVQDVVATYKELDTLALAKKVKDVLVANNIGQRIFGQAVLGLTQGSVSDLLSHPKSWQTLSLKGREPFIRMQLWLDSPNNVELIRSLKSEKQTNPNVAAASSPRLKIHSSKKKSRVVLSMDEKRTLLKAYSSEPYPSQNTVHELAKKLGKKPSTIVNWFHNYRSRVKRGFFISSDGKTTKQHKSSHNNTKQSGDCGPSDTSSSSYSATEQASPVVHPPLKSYSPDNSTDTNSAIDLSKRSCKNSMLLTAAVLLGSNSPPVAPLWSLQVANNRSMLASNGNLKTLILNVCGQSRADDASENHYLLASSNLPNSPITRENYKQTSITENATSS